MIHRENFLNTIENLKKSLEALKKDSTSLKYLEEQHDTLEKELLDLRRHLRERATAKVWSRLLAEESTRHEPVSLVTLDDERQDSIDIDENESVNFVGEAGDGDPGHAGDEPLYQNVEEGVCGAEAGVRAAGRDVP